MKAKELSKLEANELNEKIKELRRELIKDNAQVHSGGSPPNPGKLRQTKKNIARILTILKQKEVKVK
ncbi:50S ribosomal protein L29 [Candidatus Woesearchaeota archaeon]|jgi:large subunit ribosomal protein L29|nr:50S ribosomal protein L29 [Candidatus Woesearchaeota archaeon]